MEWNTLYSTQRHGFGCEKIPQKQIKPTLPQSVLPDTSIFSFRFSSEKHPIVGFRKEGIFYILFIDHNFTVYNHG